jgi:hypothetical protein
MELHASTNSTQKLKLIGKGGQFTYAPTIAIDRNLQVLNYRHREFFPIREKTKN